MSRRRQDGPKKPDLGFEAPDFDEADFIRKETISFRTTLILFLYSIVTALVTFFVWVFAGRSWAVALLVGLALGGALRFLYPALKVDISHFKRKEWIGTGFLYFFSWLAFLIFFVNPPIYDGTPPVIEVHVTPDVQTPGGPVNVTIVALDNIAVDTGTLSFEIHGPDGPVIADTSDLQRGAEGATWSWRGETADDDAGTYTVHVSVADEGRGLLQPGPQTTEATQTFDVRTDALQVFRSGEGRFTSPDDTVRVDIPREVDVYRAWLLVNGTTRIDLEPVRGEDDDERTVWRAEADFAGWAVGNNTFTVHVQEHDSYWLVERYGLVAPTATLTSTQPYEVIITDAAILGDDKASSLPRKRDATPAQTPGPEFALLIGTMVVAAAVVARRRDA